MAKKQTTETYWGSTIEISTEQQADGRWGATAAVRGQDAGTAGKTLAVKDQTSEETAASAVRSLAAGAIDAQRVTQGKP